MDIQTEIKEHLNKAYKKHPDFVDTIEKAYLILGEEIGEIGKAINEISGTVVIEVIK